MFVERVIARLRIVVAVYLSFLFFPHRITFFFFCGDKHVGKRKALYGHFLSHFFFMQFLCGFEFFFSYLCVRFRATEEGN